MADIAGLSGASNIEVNRRSTVEESRPEDEAAARDAVARETSEVQPTSTEPATNGTGTTEESNTDQSATAQGERTVADQVTLSPEAQNIVQSQAVSSDEFDPANDTNQDQRDENGTSVVNGNQNNQSEQTRTLGQIVDQFA